MRPRASASSISWLSCRLQSRSDWEIGRRWRIGPNREGKHHRPGFGGRLLQRQRPTGGPGGRKGRHAEPLDSVRASHPDHRREGRARCGQWGPQACPRHRQALGHSTEAATEDNVRRLVRRLNLSSDDGELLLGMLKKMTRANR